MRGATPEAGLVGHAIAEREIPESAKLRRLLVALDHRIRAEAKPAHPAPGWVGVHIVRLLDDTGGLGVAERGGQPAGPRAGNAEEQDAIRASGNNRCRSGVAHGHGVSW